MTTTDNFCDDLTAYELCQLGYKGMSTHFYTDCGLSFCQKPYVESSEFNGIDSYIAPTWLEAIDWLEEKGIKFDFIHCSIDKSSSLHKLNLFTNYSRTFLSAIQTAVKEGVKILKEQLE